MNTLEEHAILAIIRSSNPNVVYIDALGHPSTIPKIIKRFQAALGPQGRHIQWIMEPKADQNYPIVGAASIFAKTERDHIVDGLKEDFGDFGSGYPSDPKTKAWLTDWNRTKKPWPPFVRTRWGTIRNLAQQSMIPLP